MMLLKEYALSFLGTPYKWGGNNRLEGMDCSGFVNELLRSVGEIGQVDLSAQGLFDFYQAKGEWNSYKLGALVFYGESPAKITHVAFLIDQWRVIEAGGGGHLILTREDAAAKGAMVRIRPIKYRGDLVAVVSPRYNGIGQI